MFWRRSNLLISTNDQIRSKAYEIWKARGCLEGSPNENDWQAATDALKADREFILKVKQFELARFQAIVSTVGLVATIFAGIGLLLTYVNAQAERQLSTERLVTERFGKAIEQLGNTDRSVRVGAIYALERIENDSLKDYWTIIEVLTLFVQERSASASSLDIKNEAQATPSPRPSQAPQSVPIDVQAALTVIGRRNSKNDPAGKSINLASTNLTKASFMDASLKLADLSKANLQGANLASANLQGAYLKGANLQRAYLKGANLQGAYLVDTNLTGAILHEANLSRAKISLEDVQGGNLVKGGLSTAVLCETQLPEDSQLDPNRDCSLIESY